MRCRKRHPVSQTCPNRRRGLALIVTLLLIVMLIAAASRMATTAASTSIRNRSRANTLQHELAVDSILRVAADQLQNKGTALSDLRRNGFVLLEDRFGECLVRCRIGSDAGKLNANAFGRDEDRPTLRRKLIRLGQRLDLPDVRVQLRPVRKRDIENATGQRINLPAYITYDQLFGRRTVDGVFRLDQSDRWGEQVNKPAWSDVVTLYGDGRVDLRYVKAEVLRGLLDDIAPGAFRQLIDCREQHGANPNLSKALAKCPADKRDAIRKRLGLDIARYAFTIETAIDNDRRRWYVVAGAQDGKIAGVLYRGRITW
ncbi:MAG TPA: hypothetical protein PKN33_03135 [Phycisphaerae bacterium]|nr:hypothetical protein [Phycisphaerae bacterium]